MCNKQEEWHGSKLKDISTSNASLTKERNRGRVPYNSRSAYMRAHGKNAVGVKEERPKVKAEPQELDFWLIEASRFTKEGNV